MKMKRFKIKVQTVMDMSDSDVFCLINKFNLFGFVLIEQESSKNPRENLLALSKYFGKIIFHDHSEADGIVPITPHDNYIHYVNTTHQELTLHTDGSFEKNPPKVIAMQCRLPAAYGGLTTIMSGDYIYEYLAQFKPEILLSLFKPDAFTITRNKKTATKPIFECHDQTIYITFRSDNAVKIDVNPESLKGFELIQKIINMSDNILSFKIQTNQILVCDNTRILHGRTAFRKEDRRQLNRLWFDGQTDNCYPISLGLKTKKLSISD